MKDVLLFVLLVSSMGQALSSTCKSRCEEEIGKDARCERMCAGYEEKPQRVSKAKASKDDSETRALFELGAKKAAAARVPKTPASAASAALK